MTAPAVPRLIRMTVMGARKTQGSNEKADKIKIRFQGAFPKIAYPTIPKNRLARFQLASPHSDAAISWKIRMVGSPPWMENLLRTPSEEITATIVTASNGSGLQEGEPLTVADKRLN